MPHICILSSVHLAFDNRIFYREAQSLKKAGHHLTIIAVHDCNENREGITVIGLKKVPRWKRPLLWITIFRYAISTNADAFHFHDPELLFVAPWIRLITKKPTIYDVHEVLSDFIEIKDDLPFFIRYPAAWSSKWLEPFLSRFNNALIFADEQIASSFKTINLPKAILYNFPERSFIYQAIKATNNDSYRPSNILYLGGIKRNRGTRIMIDSFNEVHDKFPEAHLYLVGPFAPSSLEREIRSEFSRKGLEQYVTITGGIPFEKVGDYLKIAAVGWITLPANKKYSKNIPTKLFEYMAYRIPIVSSDLPPVRLFLQNNDVGYLVNPNDATAHAQAILSILDNPEKGMIMGKKGQELVNSKYNWDEMEQRLIALYREIL